MAQPLIPGIRFDFGAGRLYVIPPLSLGALQHLQDDLAALADQRATDPASVRTIIAATTAALRRNYPDITPEQVAELLDVGNMGAVFEAVMDVSGIKRLAQEAAELGNPGAGALLAGTPSSPA